MILIRLLRPRCFAAPIRGSNSGKTLARITHHAVPRAIMIMTDVISANTANGQYRYLRGLALVGAKRYDEALTDYANAIELFDNQRDIGEWVFVERPPRPAAPSSG